MITDIPQALPGFDGCEVDSPKKPELPPFKYLEVEVSRAESSIIYLKVPQNFDVKKLHRDCGKDSILTNACNETLCDSDWDHDGWEFGIECQSVKEVSEKTATAYEIYEVK